MAHTNIWKWVLSLRFGLHPHKNNASVKPCQRSDFESFFLSDVFENVDIMSLFYIQKLLISVSFCIVLLIHRTQYCHLLVWHVWNRFNRFCSTKIIPKHLLKCGLGNDVIQKYWYKSGRRWEKNSRCAGGGWKRDADFKSKLLSRPNLNMPMGFEANIAWLFNFIH